MAHGSLQGWGGLLLPAEAATADLRPVLSGAWHRPALYKHKHFPLLPGPPPIPCCWYENEAVIFLFGGFVLLCFVKVK